MEKRTIVGHIVEIINETNLVEVEEPVGNEDWKRHTFPREIFEGQVEIELGEHVTVELREYDRFAVAEARAPGPKEGQWLKQRLARADAELERTLDKLDDEIFEPID